MGPWLAEIRELAWHSRVGRTGTAAVADPNIRRRSPLSRQEGEAVGP